MFGRIIYTGLKNESYWGHIGEGHIIYYFYNIKSSEKYLKDFSILTLDKLLTGPIISYKEYFQLGYFKVIGNEENTNKNVHFPICFKVGTYLENFYRDQDDNVIEKQDICGFGWLANIFWNYTNGSTADAIRYEMATGLQVGNKWHSEKGNLEITSLKKLIKTGTLGDSDKNIATKIILDIKDALNGK